MRHSFARYATALCSMLPALASATLNMSPPPAPQTASTDVSIIRDRFIPLGFEDFDQQDLSRKCQLSPDETSDDLTAALSISPVKGDVVILKKGAGYKVVGVMEGPNQFQGADAETLRLAYSRGQDQIKLFVGTEDCAVYYVLAAQFKQAAEAIEQLQTGLNDGSISPDQLPSVKMIVAPKPAP